MSEADLHTRIRHEIEALHHFLVEWFSAALPDSDEVLETRFLKRLDPGFCLIVPSGGELNRSVLANGVRRGHGSHPQFRVAIRDVRVRAAFGNLVLATYVEWQSNGSDSTPPNNACFASVLFHVGDNVRWIHVHETWLPPREYLDVAEAAVPTATSAEAEANS